MASEDKITMDGTIIKCLPNAQFRVKIREDWIVLGYLSGRIRLYDIKISLNDRVKIEISPYDLSKGRITQRY